MKGVYLRPEAREEFRTKRIQKRVSGLVCHCICTDAGVIGLVPRVENEKTKANTVVVSVELLAALQLRVIVVLVYFEFLRVSGVRGPTRQVAFDRFPSLSREQRSFPALPKE